MLKKSKMHAGATKQLDWDPFIYVGRIIFYLV